MSNTLSIAAASAVFCDVVRSAIEGVEPGAVVRMGASKAAVAGSGAEVNVHLYRLDSHSIVRRQEFHQSDLEVVLELHFAVSFGGEKPLVAERMAGALVGRVAQTPVLLGEEVRRRIEASGMAEVLRGNDFADAREPMRVLQEFPTLEDQGRLWAGYGPGGSLFTLFFVVSPVVIDSV